jgi:hypothetical protein
MEHYTVHAHVPVAELKKLGSGNVQGGEWTFSVPFKRKVRVDRKKVEVEGTLKLKGLRIRQDRVLLTSAECDIRGSDETEDAGFEVISSMIEPISEEDSFDLLPGKDQVMGLLDWE